MSRRKVKSPPLLGRALGLYSYDPITGHFKHKTNKGKGRIGVIAGAKRKNGYIMLSIDGEEYLAHRIAWFICEGTWPDEIDHKDRIPSHNWIENLRDAEGKNQQNNGGWSLHKRKYKLPQGVRRYLNHTDRFIAELRVDGGKLHIGCFNSIEEAEEAFKKAARKYRGEFSPK